MPMFPASILSAPLRQRVVRGFFRAITRWRACAGMVAGGVAVAALFGATLPSPATAATVQGDHIVNAAQLSSQTDVVKASSTVVVVIRTPSSIEFLQYAPQLASAEKVPVAGSYYRTGSNVSDPFTRMAAPVMPGSATAIDLSQPVPLVPAGIYHSGEPIFVRLADNDQNLDRTIAETVIVTITNDKTGDAETIRLTETGPDTGVFVGYIQSTSDNNDTSYSGQIRLPSDSSLKSSYTDIVDGTDTSTSNALVDPFGILIDTKTGAPVDGAKVTLIDAATGNPAIVLGNDGVSSYPSTVVSGSTAADSAGRIYDFPPGGYRFPFIKPGNYRLDVVPPAGYAFPSQVDTATVQLLQGGPFAIVNPGSRGELFTVNPGPAIRFDIPLDPVDSALWVVKSANKELVSQGDFVLYTVTVQNTGKFAAAPKVVVTDRLPVGFRFKSGSAKIDGEPAADPAVSADGRTLTFALGDIAADKSREIRYVVEVAAGAKSGIAINQAQATHSGGGSNLAKFSVTVQDQFNRGKVLLMGRVMSGPCSLPDTEQPGLEGIRFYLEDGTFVESDKQGLFHFEGVTPGVHVVQLDLQSLPKGYEVLACEDNTRFAGRSFSQFVDLQGGTMWRVDFHVKGPKQNRTKAKKQKRGGVGGPDVDKPGADTTAATPKEAGTPTTGTMEPPRGEVRLQLKSSLTGRSASFSVGMTGVAANMKDLKLEVSLPPHFSYVAGSARLEGAPVADPEVNGPLHVFKLGDRKGDWRNELTFTATPAKAVPAGELSCAAVLRFDSDTEKGLKTPVAENTLLATGKHERIPFPEFTVRPQFPTLVAELGEGDKQMLDELVRLLSVLDIEHIQVTGHTDSVKIAPRNRHIFKDNKALSLARAKSVGEYLIRVLRLSPDKLVLAGMGDAMPVASNTSEAGRALNRRVEVMVKTVRVVNSSGLSVVKGVSDMQTFVAGAVPVAAVADKGTAPLKDEGALLERVSAVDAPVASAAGPEATAGQAGAEPPPAPAQDDTRLGILSPAAGSRLVYRHNSIRIRFDGKLLPRLMVDGKEVGSDRIGFRMEDAKTGVTLASYLGVDFGDPGEHTIRLEGLDPFGNVRFADTATVVRTGAVKAIRFVEAADNVADGKTPVRLRLNLMDDAGVVIGAPAELEVRGGTLQPARGKEPAAKDQSGPTVKMDANGWVSFAPVGQSGPYSTQLAIDQQSVTVETYVKPTMREWILVGLAEGTAGYNSVSGNMEGLKGSGTDEDYYRDGRLAFFAKGTIQGKWLLTTAYDSAKAVSPQGNGLFQTINPEAYYTLYGDASQQQYDAASARKLYVRIERDRFYAMFGDFDTGLTVTELSRYSRRLTGIKTELQAKYGEVSLFASDSSQNFAKDEIQGDGTSGLYHLSKKDILLNSEKITFEVRDRFRSEIVISSRTLSRFTDYSIDYDAGTVFFKEPVMSRDENFNPIFIVIDYETAGSQNRSWTYGGRAGLKLFDGALKTGLSHIHESQGITSGNLDGVDAAAQLGPVRLKGEFATSRSDLNATRTEGSAYLAEAALKLKRLDVKTYFREQESGFGLGQQAGSETGTRKFGTEGALKLSDRFTMNAQGYRQYNLASSAVRDLEEARLQYNDKAYSGLIGLRQVNDRLDDGTSRRSLQLVSGASLTTLKERLTLRINHDQAIGNGDNSDFPTRTTFGADYRLTRDVTVFMAEEITSGSSGRTDATRAGLKATPWKGGQFTSSVAQETAENSDRLFALFGLKQALQVTEKLSVDGGLDHSRTLKSTYQFNTNVPPASGGSEDFTAVSLGATYKEEKWSWANRLEYRTSNLEEKWGVLTGIVGEVRKGLGLSARAQVFTSDQAAGTTRINSDLRLGAAYRPDLSRWIVLDRLDLLYDRQTGSGTDLDSRRLVNNLNLNFKPDRRTQVSLQYGAKYVWELVDDGSYTGYTDLCGLEGRYDLSASWDVGLHGSALHSWSTGQFDFRSGGSIGYSMAKNTWLNLGYNLTGFRDRDFSAAGFTTKGPFVSLRFKFDQTSVQEALGSFTRD